MAYRWNDVECDTFEELQRLRGSARTTSAVVKETREEDQLCAKANCSRLHFGACNKKDKMTDLEIERTMTDREVERHNSQIECDKGPDA